jgi:3-isopropylmalate dehydratase small subunit
MQVFTSHTGVAVPMLDDDINTDQISPVSKVRELKPDHAANLFARAKTNLNGSRNPDFVLNKPQFAKPGLLVVGRNFGCGSSREAAVWALIASGIHCVIAKSVADIFRENCLQNGLLPIELKPADMEALEQRVVAANGSAPFTVDLQTQTISGPGGPDITFDCAPSDRVRLLEGLDDIGMTLKHAQDIVAWEKRTASERPWLQKAVDSRRT